MTRKRIKNPVQLIMQSNDCCLFSAQPIQELFSKSRGAAGDIGPEPNRTMYLEENGNGKYFVEKKYHLKQIIRYVQKMNVDYILKTGFSYNEAFDFPDRLYELFIKIDDKKEFEEFIRKTNFCIFPAASELKGLNALYQQALLGKEAEHITANYPLEKDLEKRVEENQKLIRKINIDFLWEKKKLFKNLVVLFASKKMIYHDLVWLNEQMEYVSDALLDPQHFSLKKPDPVYESNNDQFSGDIYRMREVWKTFLVPGHRIYGHFAYCCFEFFLDIKDQIAMVVCPYCGRIIGPKDGKKRRCGEENSKCQPLQQKEDRRIQRINKEKIKTVDK